MSFNRGNRWSCHLHRGIACRRAQREVEHRQEQHWPSIRAQAEAKSARNSSSSNITLKLPPYRSSSSRKSVAVTGPGVLQTTTFCSSQLCTALKCSGVFICARNDRKNVCCRLYFRVALIWAAVGDASSRLSRLEASLPVGHSDSSLRLTWCHSLRYGVSRRLPSEIRAS